MNRITTIVVDDEQENRYTLTNFLSNYCPEIKLVGEAASVQEAVVSIHDHNPQLVFLDINMPFENGLALFQHFPAPSFYTVFVTAYDRYALDAIKRNALDYLLKPISIEELVRAVALVKERLNDRSMLKNLQTVLHELQIARKPQKIALPVAEGLVYVNASDIMYCEAETNYTRLHFADGKKMLVSQTLGNYEHLLESHDFIRVHNRWLINLNFVDKYQRGRGGLITMKNNTEISVSQRKKDDFLRRMMGKQFE